MVNTNAVTTANKNVVAPKTGDLLSLINPEMLIGIVSVFAGGGMLGGGSGGGSLIGTLLGGGSSCGNSYGNYGNSYSNGNSGDSFLTKMLTGAGLTLFATSIISVVTGLTSKKTETSTDTPVGTAQQFDKWSQSNISEFESGKKVDEFKFVGSEYTKDIKENGGKNALKLYKEGLMKLSGDTIKMYDTSKDNKVDIDEFAFKEFENYKKADPEAVIDDKLKAEMKETYQKTFKTIDLNHDGILSEEEQATVFATLDEDEKTKMHNGRIELGSLARFGQSVENADASVNLQRNYDMFFGDAK